MTDNEIIKALECCPYYDVCLNCPCFSFCGCTPEVFENALDLINRKKNEIEALIAGQETLQKYRDGEINSLKAKIEALQMDNKQLETDNTN